MTKRKAKLGDCYEAALKYALTIPKDERDRYRVVHGFPIGQGDIAGVKHGHAWVERTDPIPEDLPEQFRHVSENDLANLFVIVIDKSNGKDIEYPRGLYYGIGRIDPDECRYYTVVEACKLCAEHGHWGRWHDVEGAA